jgi:Fe-S-cluster containining protein
MVEAKVREKMPFKYPKDICFECSRCALCCGDTKNRKRSILLLDIESGRISQKTSKTPDEFAEEVEGFEPYVYRMKKTSDGRCVFLKNNLCSIYEIRPLICRFYPFQLRSIGANKYVFECTDECPGIGKGPKLKREFFEKLFKVLEASAGDSRAFRL